MREVGAVLLPNNCCKFRLWAPLCKEVEIHILGPNERVVAMQPRDFGYHELTLEDVAPGTQYLYRLDSGKKLPDPASRSQPLGVHGPSEVIDPAFEWEDRSWFGFPLEYYIIYELHVGA